jgi:hypothetical protein
MDFNLNYKKSSQKYCYTIYILYIVILITIVYLIYKFIYFNNDTFDNILNKISTSNTDNISPDIIKGLRQTQINFNNIKEKINNKLTEHDNAVYISDNFNQINPNSFNINKDFIDLYFDNNNYPSINLTDYKVINNEIELNNLINQAGKFKNIYQPGDIVNAPSSFDNINDFKNKICFKSNNDLNKKYSDCMVCSVNPSNDYKNTNSWENTSTNIKDLCLFNLNAQPNTGIANLDDCKKLCNINNTI